MSIQILTCATVVILYVKQNVKQFNQITEFSYSFICIHVYVDLDLSSCHRALLLCRITKLCSNLHTCGTPVPVILHAHDSMLGSLEKKPTFK